MCKCRQGCRRNKEAWNRRGKVYHSAKLIHTSSLPCFCWCAFDAAFNRFHLFYSFVRRATATCLYESMCEWGCCIHTCQCNWSCLIFVKLSIYGRFPQWVRVHRILWSNICSSEQKKKLWIYTLRCIAMNWDVKERLAFLILSWTTAL